MSIKKDAEELGITVDGQWSDDIIQEAIDAKLNEDAEKPKEDDAQEKPKKPTPKKAVPKKPKKADKVIRNISGVRFKVYGRIVQPGGEYTPTATDLKDVKGGKRIENAIKKGYLSRG